MSRTLITFVSNLDGWFHRHDRRGFIARTVCNYFEYCLDREALLAEPIWVREEENNNG